MLKDWQWPLCVGIFLSLNSAFAASLGDSSPVVVVSKPRTAILANALLNPPVDTPPTPERPPVIAPIPGAWPTAYPAPNYKVIEVRGGDNDHDSIANAFDGNWLTSWSTPSGARTPPPHYFVLDFGEEIDVQGFLYIPTPYRAEGRPAKYALYISSDTAAWGEPVARGSFRKYTSTFWPDVNEQFETLILPNAVRGRYLKFQVFGDLSGNPVTSIAEFVVITDLENYPYKQTTLAHLKGQRMTPSIHISYKLPPARLFYVAMTPEQTAPGAYIMTAGFSGGYFGIQEQGDGNRLILFSLWDAANVDNPFLVHRDDQVKILYEAPEMLVRRFGGEGVGVQSFFNYHWEVGQQYEFVVKVDHQLLPGWTAFSAFFYVPEEKGWKKLMTLATKNPNIPLTGLHSFLEDFKRDFKSFKQQRGATFSSIWAIDVNTDSWVHCQDAFFTVDGNPNRNINAKTCKKGIYAVTGGDIQNEDGKIWTTIPVGQEGNTPPNLPREVIEKALPDDVEAENIQDKDDE